MIFLLFFTTGHSSISCLLGCSYRGQIILYGEELRVDECTTCFCADGTVQCNIKSCPPTFCDEPFTDPDECCAICPFCKSLTILLSSHSLPFLFGIDCQMLKCLLKLFADVVHVSNHWILAQAMAHAPVPNFDVPLLLCCDHFDQWCEPRLAWTSWCSNRVKVTCTTAANCSLIFRTPTCIDTKLTDFTNLHVGLKLD